MIKHELKILPEYFCQVKAGLKTFEIRKNDRGYQVGDLLELKEWNDGNFTSNSVLMQVTYITDYAQKDNYVVIGIKSPHTDSVVAAENELSLVKKENDRLRIYEKQIQKLHAAATHVEDGETDSFDFGQEVLEILGRF